MKKLSIDPFDIQLPLVKESADVLAKGGIVALPTETVYGLAGRIDKDDVVQKLYDIKGRSKEKPFTVAVGSIDKAIFNIFITLPPFGHRLIENFWPGPLTIVYEAKDGSKTGVRVPGHAVTREILNSLNVPVFLPSANLSGQQESLSANEVEAVFDDKIDMIVDGGKSTYGQPSTVVDLSFAPFKILREGVVSETEIIQAFIRKRIVFVCAGNTCRSPVAQYLLAKYMRDLKPHKAERYEIISRGLVPLPENAISEKMAALLEREENILSADFVSKTIDRHAILSADLIFTMDDDQLRHVLEIEPTALGRVFALKKFLPPELERDIPDPVGKDLRTHEEVYKLIKKAVNELIHWL